MSTDRSAVVTFVGAVRQTLAAVGLADAQVCGAEGLDVVGVHHPRWSRHRHGRYALAPLLEAMPHAAIQWVQHTPDGAVWVWLLDPETYPAQQRALVEERAARQTGGV